MQVNISNWVRKGENASISVSSMRIDAIGSYQQKDMSTTDTDIATSAKLVTGASDSGHVEADTVTIKMDNSAIKH